MDCSFCMLRESKIKTERVKTEQEPHMHARTHTGIHRRKRKTPG